MKEVIIKSFKNALKSLLSVRNLIVIIFSIGYWSGFGAGYSLCGVIMTKEIVIVQSLIVIFTLTICYLIDVARIRLIEYFENK